MPATFPSKLPIPNRSGFSGEFQLPLRALKMADGSHRTVMNYRVQPRIFSLQWILTWEQAELYEAFVQYDVLDGDGYAVFNFLKYTSESTDTPLTGRFVAKDGLAYTLTYDEERDRWLVDAVVEILTDQFFGTAIAPRPADFPEWPSTLPRLPDKKGYVISPDIGYMRSDMEEGLAQQFQRRKSRHAEIPVSYIFDLEQQHTFDLFYQYTLGFGAFAFYTWLANGSGESRVLCKFGSMPQMKPNGSIYEVNFKLRTAQLPLMTETAYRDAIE